MIPPSVTIRGVEIATKTIFIVLGLIALCVICATVPSCVTKWKSDHAQSKVNREQGKAAVESGRDAVNTAANVADRAAQGEATGEQNERTIRNAQGSDVKAGRAVTGAGIDGLCDRAAYRDSERCRLRRSAAR